MRIEKRNNVKYTFVWYTWTGRREERGAKVWRTWSGPARILPCCNRNWILHLSVMHALCGSRSAVRAFDGSRSHAPRFQCIFSFERSHSSAGCVRIRSNMFRPAQPDYRWLMCWKKSVTAISQSRGWSRALLSHFNSIRSIKREIFRFNLW